MISIQDSIRMLADKFPPLYDGKITVHTGTAKTIDEILVWTSFLLNVRINHAGEVESWITGDCGVVSVLVKYKRGLLGEPVPKQYTPADENKMADDSVRELMRLTAMEKEGVREADLFDDISRNPNNN